MVIDFIFNYVIMLYYQRVCTNIRVKFCAKLYYIRIGKEKEK